MPLQQAEDLRQLRAGEVHDPLAELGVERLLRPGQVLPRAPDAGCGARQADLGRIIQQEYGVAPLQPGLQRAQIIAVDDPAVPRQDLRQPIV